MKKRILACLLLLPVLLSACTPRGKPDSGTVSAIPSDFTFSLTWDVNGISSYDSATGKLVKTSDATHPQDYITTLFLSDSQRETVRAALSALDLSRYPEAYNPSPGTGSEPSMTLKLSVRYGDAARSIACENIAVSYESDDADGRLLLTACKTVIDLITGTGEWKALPDYEFYYD